MKGFGRAMENGDEEQSTAKRRRICRRDEENFRPGSIMEVELENFMTYTKVRSSPAPRLNLVLGPNGSGKSTLVCAICLGLAGDTAFGMPTGSTNTSNSTGSRQSTSQMAGSQYSPLTPREREMRELQQVERIRAQLEKDLKEATDRENEIKNRTARLETLESDKADLEGLDDSGMNEPMKVLRNNMLLLHAHVDSRLDFMQSTLDQILDILTRPGFRPPAQLSLPLSAMSGPFPVQAGSQPSGTSAAAAQTVAFSSSGPAVIATSPSPVQQSGQQQGQWYPKTPMKPPLAFSGERKDEELNTWLRTVPVWVKAKRTLPEDEVVTAASYLEGKAAKWLDGVVVKVGSVRELTTTVESLILVPGINYSDQFLLTTFVRCLPENMRNLLASEARTEYHSFETLSRKALDLEATLGNAQSTSGNDSKKKKNPQEKGAKLMMVESDGTQTEIDELSDLMDYSEYDGEEVAEGSTLAAVVKTKAGGRGKGQPRSQGKAASNQSKQAEWVKKPFIVTTDASQYDIGAVLAQQDGKKLRPIEYMSKKMPSKKEYMSKKMPSKKLAKSTYERELYALYKALVHWRHFLLGRFFYLRADHQTLKRIKTQRALSDALKRWIELIDQYDFKLEYLKGEYNKVADALSRRADYLGALVSKFGVSNEVTQSLVGTYQEDSITMDIIRKLQAKDKATESVFVMVDGLIYLDNDKAGVKRLVVPSSEQLRSLFLGECHDATGHFGYKKTSANLVQRFWWPRMLDDAKKYVETCQVCQRDKPRIPAPLGLLKPLPIPDGPGLSVSMDFMDTLVTSKSGKRHIFVIIDRFTKYATLIPMSETARTEYVIMLFKANWVRDFGLPKTIISDRDVRFTSELWKKTAEQMGSQLQTTSGNHPEANRQAGQMSRVVQHLLRHYIKPSQDDWDEQLPLIASLYNNAIHRRSVAKKEVERLVEGFNIQVGNLCQFLPQDRVCEFAQLTPVRLLEETERAVGGKELQDKHRLLIEKCRQLKLLETTVVSHTSKLEKWKEENAQLEGDISRVKQRQEMLAEVDVMKKKLPWLHYDAQRQLFVSAKERAQQAKVRRDEVANQVLVAEKPLNNMKTLLKKAEAEAKRLKEKTTDFEKKRKKLMDDAELTGTLQAKRSEIDEIRRNETARMEKMAKLEAEVAHAEQELAAMPPIMNRTAELEDLSKQAKELEMALREKQREQQEKQGETQALYKKLQWCSDRLEAIMNAKDQRLRLLAQRLDRHIMQTYQWVQENRGRFRGEVFGPVLLEVNVPQKEHAQYLEGHVPKWVWKCYVVDNDEDRTLLNHELKEVHNWGVSIVKADSDDQDLYARVTQGLHVTQEMREYGITHRLDEVLDAPQAVKNVLLQQAAVDQSFIGTRVADRNAESLHRLGVGDMWTPDNHYRWTRSRYSNKSSCAMLPVAPAALFSQELAAKEEQEMQAKKEEIRSDIRRLDDGSNQIKQQMKATQDQLAGVNRQREVLYEETNSQKRRQRMMEVQIEQKKQKLDGMRKDDFAAVQEQRARNEIKDAIRQKVNHAMDLVALEMEMMQAVKASTASSLRVAELEYLAKRMADEFRECSEEGNRAQAEFEECARAAASHREKLRKAKEDAEQVCRVTTELQEKFAQLPVSVEALEDAIQDTEYRANAILCHNPNVVAEYELRSRQIKDLSKKLEEEEVLHQNGRNEIENLKNEWLPTLRELVGNINESFGRNFQEMAIAGEVSLDEHGMDFEKYGILIKVKFRENEDLQVLSAQHQSGGERSVSTILYLLSMQDLTTCPFRVVDEINQGMDFHNERKMFQQLVRSSSKANTPQCFLLTPKLLPNLEYSRACTILQVMNGPWISSASDYCRRNQSSLMTIF
ncbi:hypothetical protein CBR_g88572 [Chara braunii]|uniref:Structural maintenance of chromosomes protein 5 n=1 Tax=Chara braunii TaxID=69332 RepID=A0A388KB44_CHABU|nr:hypothetical protein CBR_g88572 [Chara braunii]|eukprot:GBG67284.1 hypothetical protein CBR_g88572 [Chara braunii]